MATRPKSSASPWLRFSAGVNTPYVYGPADAVAAWMGSAPTGPVTLSFGNWQTLLPLLPPELTPHGDPDAPTLRAESADAARVLVKRLGAALATKHKVKTKVDKASGTTIFTLPDGAYCALYWIAETRGEVALAEAGDDQAPRVITGPGGPLLMAPVQAPGGGLATRVVDGDVVFADADGTDDALDQLMAQTSGATELGTWRFGPLAVAQSALASPVDLKGVDDAVGAVGAWTTALGKKKAVALKPKNRDHVSQAAVLVIAPGTYRASASGGGAGRFLRFTPT